MANKKYILGPTRAELIEAARNDVTKLFRLERERLEIRAELSHIGCELVNRCKMSIVDAAAATGMTRQRLAQELRILELTGDQEEGK
jgi:hypothetical protein